MAKAKKTEQVLPKSPLGPLDFEAEFNGETVTYRIVYPIMIIPRLGKVKADELIQMPEVLAELVEMKSGAIQKI